MGRLDFVGGDYMRHAISFSVRHEDGYRAFEHNGRYYDRNYTGVIVPLGTKRYIYDYREPSWFGPMLFDWAYRNAEFFRWSLVDESIPLEDNQGTLFFGLFDGCRRSNAIAVEFLRYWPALPELREAMLHEHDCHLRHLCVEAIGSMGEHATGYARDVGESIRKFNDPWYQGAAVKTLGKIGDKTCVPLLRELFEEVRARIDALSFNEVMDREDQSIDLIGDITGAIIRLDPAVGREILAMELASPNPHVRHFVRREFQLSGRWDELKFMESGWSSIVSALPSDSHWVYRRSKGRLVR